MAEHRTLPVPIHNLARDLHPVGQPFRLRSGFQPLQATESPESVSSARSKKMGRIFKRALHSPRDRARSGQVLVEYALVFAGIIVPFTFGIIFMAQLLWVWHSMVEFTREGARYATTHCWQAGGANVLQYMYTHVPVNVEQAQFSSANANATVTVNYFTVDPDSGTLSDFSCDSDCTTGCVPDVVTVSVDNYVYGKFFTFLKLPGVPMPSWPTSMPMEGAGCDPASGVCLP